MALVSDMFVYYVLKGIKNELRTAGPEDRALMANTALHCFRHKFSLPDAIAYCKTFEEVCPDLDETEAIKAHDALDRKYGVTPPRRS
jgi:hypothetical protein